MRQSIKAVGLTGSYRKIRDRIEKRFGKRYAVGDSKTPADFNLKEIESVCEPKMISVDDSSSDESYCRRIFNRGYVPYNRGAIEANHKDNMSHIDDSISTPNEGRKRFNNETIGVLADIDGKISVDIGFSDYSRIGKVCIIKNGCIPVEDSDGRLVIDLEKDINSDGDEFRSMETLVAI